MLNCPAPSLASGRSSPTGSDIPVSPAGDDARMPSAPAAGPPGGAVSVVGNEAGHGRPASGRRFERRQGWRSEIKRAAPSGGRAALQRGTRLGYPSGRLAARRDFIALSRQAPRKCSGATLSLRRSSHSPGTCHPSRTSGAVAGVLSRRQPERSNASTIGRSADKSPCSSKLSGAAQRIG